MWRRRFQHAIVVVNTTVSPVSVLVNGARVSIDPTDAVIAGI